MEIPLFLINGGGMSKKLCFIFNNGRKPSLTNDQYPLPLINLSRGQIYNEFPSPLCCMGVWRGYHFLTEEVGEFGSLEKVPQSHQISV